MVIFIPSTPVHYYHLYYCAMSAYCQRPYYQIQLFGHDPAVIHIPLTQVYLQQLYSQSLEFQCAVADFVGDVNIHLPSDKLLQNLPTLNIHMGEKFSTTPIPKARTIFIDGSGKTGKLLSPGKKGTSGNIFFLEGTLPPNRRKFQGLFLPSSIGPKCLLI